MEDQQVNYEEDLTLTVNNYERGGYVFRGWNTAANGSGVSYPAGYTFSPWQLTGDLTLYAQWEKIPAAVPAVSAPETGNNSNLSFWMSLLTVSILTLAVGWKKREGVK